MQLTAVDFEREIPDLVAQLAKPGLLLTVADPRRQANVMTIGWASFGRVWGQPMCMVMVRPSRYTFDLINTASVFTVDRMPAGFEKGVARCGSASGRDVDKLAEQGWHVLPGQTQGAPYVVEAALHLECRTVFTTEVTPDLEKTLIGTCYPQGDYHRLYFGQITGCFRHE